MLAGATLSARAAEPLVDVDWVVANLGKPGIVLVDIRGEKEFERVHIPGSVYTDYGHDGWREKQGAAPGKLPADPKQLAAVIGALGIDNDTHVVILPIGANAGDVGVATRIFWTFKVLGHDNVSILDGGLIAYAAERKNGVPVNPLEGGAMTATPKIFKVNLRPEMLVTVEDVEAAAAGNGVALVDARTPDEFTGAKRSPGTIHGARNLPEYTLVDEQGGKFLPVDQLKAKFAAAGVETAGDQIDFCNTGHRASLLWFVANELLGDKGARLYDGSITEWDGLGKPVEPGKLAN
ncbi:MAG: sulfurtransferase [Hyphomicrobiales bacterium]